MTSRITDLVLEGGGAAGGAYVGAIRALEDRGILRGVRSVTGASAGAITALALALGATAGDLRLIYQQLDLASLGGSAWQIPFRWPRAWFTGGLYPIRPLRRVVERVFDIMAVRRDLRFSHHEILCAGESRHCKGFRTLRVALTSYALEGSFVAGPENTPHWPLLEAVVASAAIPVWFPPVEIDGGWYCDGGVARNIPMDVPQVPPEHILGLRVDSPGEILGTPRIGRPPRMLSRLGLRLFRIARKEANNGHIPEGLWSRVIRIPTEVKATDFDLGRVGREDLERSGYEATIKGLNWMEANL